ncbi:hypothetical protein M514_08006 [Trichuris suis]|uniref:Uncharacterized protein n=1 Tax=Trichuris suis TaxID=68888 RepID=A0A085M1L0_9BILA|nr:hypothetical protein M513_08006 [Trichuris suis]KFD63077.1 hypothetical protein M514_08006 [Trichuris suis]
MQRKGSGQIFFESAREAAGANSEATAELKSALPVMTFVNIYDVIRHKVVQQRHLCWSKCCRHLEQQGKLAVSSSDVWLTRKMYGRVVLAN